MIKIELLLIAALVCLSVCAPGEPVFSDNQEFLEQYFSVKSVENKAISNPTLERVASRDFVSLNYSTPGLHKNRVQIDWDKVINIAEKIWKFVMDNQPIADYKKFYGNALPKGLSSSSELYHWVGPSAHPYTLKWQNAYGMTVVEFTYSVMFMWNGTYDGTHGHYLDHITVTPVHLSVAWGYTFQATVKIPTVVNAGSKQFPMAAAVVELDYMVSTPLKKDLYTDSFTVKANGQFIHN